MCVCVEGGGGLISPLDKFLWGKYPFVRSEWSVKIRVLHPTRPRLPHSSTLVLFHKTVMCIVVLSQAVFSNPSTSTHIHRPDTMAAYLRQKQKVRKYLAFDSSKPSGGKLFTVFLLLTLVCREFMGQKEKNGKIIRDICNFHSHTV